MGAYTGYMICTSPRSGSTLLCQLLAATGMAGAPASQFYHADWRAWAKVHDIDPDAKRGEADLLPAILAAALDRGRAGTGVFGLRQQRPAFPYLCLRLAALYPEEPSDAARLSRAFGPLLYVHLSRSDKVAQAVSLVKAQQTGLWHVAPDGTEIERLAAPAEPVFDREALRAAYHTVAAYDRGWTDWFAQEGIAPLKLSYDALSEDPLGALRRILRALDLDPTAADKITPGVRKLADATNAEWMARLRGDLLLEPPRPDALHP